ncbi:MAG TPA: hypothetical protein VK357_10675, partial [Rubrobacteraceae bacterium]|nr:hypothetical protein [Rubrobacteraceae bacterium]
MASCPSGADTRSLGAGAVAIGYASSSGSSGASTGSLGADSRSVVVAGLLFAGAVGVAASEASSRGTGEEADANLSV